MAMTVYEREIGVGWHKELTELSVLRRAAATWYPALQASKRVEDWEEEKKGGRSFSPFPFPLPLPFLSLQRRLQLDT